MKLLIFLLGLAGGAAATSAWIISEPDNPAVGASNRLSELKTRVDAALAEGVRAQIATEQRLQSRLDALRSRSAAAAR